MSNCYEIYGSIEMPLSVYEAEKNRLLAEILKWIPPNISGATTGAVIICFDAKDDEDLHYVGATLGSLGGTLVEGLQRLWDAYPGQVNGDVFILNMEGQQTLKRISMGDQFTCDET